MCSFGGRKVSSSVPSFNLRLFVPMEIPIHVRALCFLIRHVLSVRIPYYIIPPVSAASAEASIFAGFVVKDLQATLLSL